LVFQGAGSGGSDRRTVGERVAEGYPEFDEIDSRDAEGADDGFRGRKIGVAGPYRRGRSG